MTRQGKAYVYGLTTVLIWSTIASAFKISLRYLEPIQLLLYAGSVSTLLLAVILLVQGKFRLIFHCTRQQYAMQPSKWISFSNSRPATLSAASNSLTNCSYSSRLKGQLM